MTVLPFLNDADRSEINELCKAAPKTADLAFVTFATSLGKSLSADYRCADLRGYFLHGQDLSSVDLTGADLRDADLRKTKGIDLDKVIAEGALLDDDCRAEVDGATKWLRRWHTFSTDNKISLAKAEVPLVLKQPKQFWSEQELEAAGRFRKADFLEIPPHFDDFFVLNKINYNQNKIFVESKPTPDSEFFIMQPGNKSLFSSLSSLNRQFAIEIGTSSTKIYQYGRGIVLIQPSIVGIQSERGIRRVTATGLDASIMMGKAFATFEAIRPLRDGVIADVEVAEQMLMSFLRKISGGRWQLRGPRIVACVPSGASQVERRALRDALVNAGANRVQWIFKPIAAAVGAGLPLSEAAVSMIVEIGAGTTEIGVLSFRTIAITRTVRVGGDRMDEAIVLYLRRNHNILIGERTAERIKKGFGTAVIPDDGIGQTIHVRGRDLVNGVPKEIVINQANIAEALSEPLYALTDGIRRVLEDLDPNLAADIVDQGIVLTGGGALLSGIADLLRDETGLPVKVADDPLSCVILGAGRVMEDASYERLLIDSGNLLDP